MDALQEAGPVLGGLAAVGSVVVFSVVYKFLISTYKTFLRPGKDLTKLGEWSIVTGATDGIGKAYAVALAARGLNVVLISRTASKLEAVKSEINTKHPSVQVKCVVCDYSNFDEKAQKTVSDAVQPLNVAVLVNNVGASYRYPMYFHELSDTEVSHLERMNVDSTVRMTRLVLPGMLNKKAGCIVNISSAAARYPLPLLAEYSATKAFVERFSTSLNAEYAASHGVTVQCQVPFYVATKLAKLRKSISVPTPEDFVALAVRWIGYGTDAVVSPFWIHAVQGWIMFQLPEWIVTSAILNMHLAIRKKGKKKDEKLATEGKEGKKDS